MLRNTLRLLPVVLMMLTLSGCSNSRVTQVPDGPYRTLKVDPIRDTDAARKLHQRGLKHLDKDELDKAEKAFREALSEDIQFGPAHNSLGHVLFKRKKWYEAAWEFELAHKQMPNQAEPLNNLGLVMAIAPGGRLDDAVDYHRRAAGLDPANIEYRANLAVALIKRGDRTDEVPALLKQILAEDRRPEWIVWAKHQLARLTGTSISQ